MKIITIKQYEEQKDTFKGVDVIIATQSFLQAESYTADGKKIGVVCLCGGSGYVCQPCLKMWLHEAEFHGKGDGLILVRGV